LEEPTSNLVRNHLWPRFEAAAHLRRFADIQEGTPTSDQLINIFEYLGRDKIGSVVEGASSPTEALRKLKEDGNLFQRPVVVDWGNGRAGILSPYQKIGCLWLATDISAVSGDNESEILKLLQTPSKA
jgi:hypothetical protein